LFCVCFKYSNAQEDYPILTEFVTDKADLFRESETLKLREKLKAYETEKTHQIVVLTINSLGDNTVENYANDVFNKNEIGQKEADNGILIVIAKNERRFRIEVGYGLEPIITDAFASRIIRNTMTPKFKKGDFYGGVDDATSEIIKLIDDPKYRDEFTNLIEQEGKMPLWGKVIIGFILFIFFSLFIGSGLMVLFKGFKQLINLFRGLITGKVSIILFPFLLIGSLLTVAFSLPFIVVPIIFGTFIIQTQLDDNTDFNPFECLESLPLIAFQIIIISLVGILIIVPLFIAIFTRSKNNFEPVKFSLLKSDKTYMSKNFSSSGSSSSSYSSSSSSSFSGGGGSSGGGGASGSW
jgi:uncharacterized protein